MCGFNKGVRLSIIQKWAEEIILNLVDLFNSRDKDGTKRNDDRTEEQTNKSRDNPKGSQGKFKSLIPEEVDR